MKATSYTKMKRLLALILTICMVMSGISLTSFAGDGDNSKSSSISTTDEQEEETGLRITKTATDNGTDVYDLTIEAYATATVEQVSSSEPLDIVLLLDLSTSMDNSKMSALKTSAGSFIDAVAKNATDNDVEHRISIIKFAKNGYKNINNHIAVGNDREQSTRYNYTQVVADFTSAKTGANSLKTTVNSLASSGYTNADYGLNLANELITENGLEGNKKVVVMFTDGAPSNGNAGAFQGDVANRAITAADALKDKGVTIYTLGIFSSSDSKKDEIKRYMNYVSSNFHEDGLTYQTLKQGSTTVDGYFLTASSVDDLEEVFTTISRDVVNITKVADETSVLADTVSKYFTIADPENASNCITVQKQAYTGKDNNGSKTWGTLSDVEDIVKAYDPDTRIISVTGFDYTDKANLVMMDGNTPNGYKLVVTCKLKLADDITEAPEEILSKLPTNDDVNINDGDPDDDPFIDTPESPVIDNKDAKYRIEYYLQEDATKGDYANYKKVDNDTTTSGDIALYTEIDLNSQKSTIEAKYSGEGYKFEAANPASYKLVMNPGDNVFKFYYEHNTKTVTVNQFVRTDTITEENKRISTSYGTTPRTTKTYVVNEFDEFNVPAEDLLTSYICVKENEGVRSVFSEIEAGYYSDSTKIARVVGGETINLYYYTETKKAAIEVYYNFEEWEYKLVNGTYTTEPEFKSREVGKEPVSTQLVEMTSPEYTWTILSQEGYKYYQGTATLDGNPISDNNGENVIVSIENNQVYKIVLTYRHITDNRGAKYPVKAFHNYTLTKHIINDEGVLETCDPITYNNIHDETRDGKIGYKGEIVTFNEVTTYDNISYIPSVQNDNVLPHTIQGNTQDDTIQLYYSAEIYPDTTKVKVITECYRIDTLIDTTTGAISYPETLEISNEETFTKDSANKDLYVNQKYIAEEPSHTGYTARDDKYVNNYTITSLKDMEHAAENVIILKYYKGGEKPEVAKVGINHNYFSIVTEVKANGTIGDETYEDGSRDTIYVFGEPDAKYDGFEFIPEYNGNNYPTYDKDQNLDAFFGGNNVSVNYYRDYSRLGEAIEVEVVHEYYTRHMTVENGVAGYFVEPTEPDFTSDEFILTQNGTEVTTLYSGMKVDVKLEETGNYKFDNKTLYQGVTVTDGMKIVLRYYQKDELETVTPVVTHTYFDINYTYDENWVEHVSDPVEKTEWTHTVSSENPMYVGLTYDAAEETRGYTLIGCRVNGSEYDIDNLVDAKYILTLTSNRSSDENLNRVDYIYQTINGRLTKANITVEHYYSIIDDYTNEITGYVEGEEYEPLVDRFDGYVGQPFTASHNHLDGLYPDEPTSNRDEHTTLVAGDNGTIKLYYVKHINSAPFFAVIYHDGYSEAEPVIDGYTNETADFVIKSLASTQFSREGYTFKGWSVEADSESVAAAFDAGNKITLNVAEDGTLEVYDATGKLIATADETGRLTLCSVEITGQRYHIDLYAIWEKTPVNNGGHSSKPTSNPTTEEEPEDIEEEEIPLAEEPEIIAEPEIIEEPEVPLADQTGEEALSDFFEEDVPLADVPATGDGMLDIVVIMVASAVILMGYALLSRLEGKKNK